MNFILGLHGIVALLLFCSLLFAEEAGVPLPVPGELMLIAAGILIGTGALDPWLFGPLAYASILAGAFTGYSWARLLGEHGLQALAERLHQREKLARAGGRLQKARAREIAISRLIPGLRVYTTLLCGAAGVERERFLIGLAPATAVWMTFFLVLGVFVGAPAEHFLGQIEALAVQGGVLVAIGIAAYLAIRRVPAAGREMLQRLHPTLRIAGALLVDITLIASVVAGVLAVVRPLTPAGDLAGWVDIVVVILVIAAFYSVVTRRGRHATAGENLFGAAYLTRHQAGAPGPHGLREAVRSALEQTSRSTPALSRAADQFRMLGDPRRLCILHRLLLGDRSECELERDVGLSGMELSYELAELRRAGLIQCTEGPGEDTRYGIVDEHLRHGLAEILAGRDQSP